MSTGVRDGPRGGLYCHQGKKTGSKGKVPHSKTGRYSLQRGFVLEGGCLAYLEFDPLDEKDKAPKWRLVLAFERKGKSYAGGLQVKPAGCDTHTAMAPQMTVLKR
eukprot:scaffold81075_cov18-Tisochrysis_lutea.AAC.1